MRSHARGLTHGVADGLEEEQREEAADAGPPPCVADSQREGTARGGKDAQQKRGVHVVQKHDAHESRVAKQ